MAVWDALSRGVAHQALPDGKMKPEYADDVVKMGYGGSEKLHEVDLHTHGG